MAPTTSTATIARAIDETFGWDNLHPTAGVFRNQFWSVDTPLVWGIQRGKFTFDFESIAFRFSNMSPPIPENVQILSAFLRGTATQTSTASLFFSVIVVLGNDGLWNVPSAGPQWRSAGDATATDMDVAVLNVVAGTMADTAVPITDPWAIRDNAAGRYLKAGQGVEITAAGTLGFVDISMVRNGAPSGNVWCEVYSQDGSGLADTLLATSNTRPASSAPGAMAPFRFTFSAGQQIPLALGQDIVVVLNGDFPLHASVNVSVGYAKAGYVPGTFQLFGTGVALDDQNYPLQEDFRSIPNGATGFDVWVAPQFTAGVDYDSADFSSRFEEFIGGSYAEGDPFAILLARSLAFFPAGTADRRWANFAHPTFPPVRLIVEWQERISVFVLRDEMDFDPLTKSPMDFDTTTDDEMDFDPLTKSPMDYDSTTDDEMDFGLIRAEMDFDPLTDQEMDFGLVRAEMDFDPLTDQEMDFSPTKAETDYDSTSDDEMDYDSTTEDSTTED